MRQLVAGSRAPRRREQGRSWWHDPANDALEARLCGRLPSHSLFHISMCSPLNISTFLTVGQILQAPCDVMRRVKVCIFVNNSFLPTSPQFFDSDFNRNRKDSHKKGTSLYQGTAQQAGSSRVRFPMVSLEFFIYIILPAALWPWG